MKLNSYDSLTVVYTMCKWIFMYIFQHFSSLLKIYTSSEFLNLFMWWLKANQLKSRVCGIAWSSGVSSCIWRFHLDRDFLKNFFSCRGNYWSSDHLSSFSLIFNCLSYFNKILLHLYFFWTLFHCKKLILYKWTLFY